MEMLEEAFRAIELFLRMMSKKSQPLIYPNLDPVLLVPGTTGSIMNAVDEIRKEERVWARVVGADHEFRVKLWSLFDPSTGKTVSLDAKTRIKVPEDRYGLYALFGP